jgi:hypothetical protein
MNIRTLTGAFFGLLFLLSFQSNIQARLGYAWSYQEMFDKAELVVIAQPIHTKDTTETNSLPGINPSAKFRGLSTEFQINAVLKSGQTNALTRGTKITFHHYRFNNPAELVINGPVLVEFTPEKSGAFQSYLLFLVKKADGRYAPVTGQVDPDISVLKLDGRAD